MLRAFFSICGICGASGEGELSVFLHEVLGALLELFDGVDLHAALHNGFLHAGGQGVEILLHGRILHSFGLVGHNRFILSNGLTYQNRTAERTGIDDGFRL